MRRIFSSSPVSAVPRRLGAPLVLTLLVSCLGCLGGEREVTEVAIEPGNLGREAADPPTARSKDLAMAPRQRIVFLGDSLTAGYGLAEDQAYPALLRERLDQAGWPAAVVNAGISGDTSAGGLRRVDWLLQQPIDVLVLALGANDGLRGLSLAQTRNNLQAIVDRVRAADPTTEIIVAGMLMPPNLGPEYTAEFGRLFPELAERNGLALVPFLLEGVAAQPELNQSDGIHPTADGQRRVAETVWRTLEPILEERLAAR
jgi:acyl-CoA thioesterase-1